MTQTAATTGTGAAKRRDRRFIVDQQALVSCSAVPDLLWTARIADISRRGMLLVLEQPPHFRENVCIQWNDREVRGTVRRRERQGSEYHVGVELANSRKPLLVEILARENEEMSESARRLRRQRQELKDALGAAARASEVKSRFLASVSHELRTPLNGIIGFSEMLYDAKVGPVSDEQKDYLSDILICSQHLLTLVNQVLDLTRIESGKMEFEYEPVHVEGLAGEVVEGMKALAAGKRITVEVECDRRIGVVEADAARLRQVLFNYVSNALKFTPPGGRVVVRIAPEEPAGYRIQVRDNGVGIRPEDLSRLFIEFAQLEAARRDGVGTGLGLAITRRIVEEQGGRVGVESSPGAGSTFWAVLPMKPVPCAGPEIGPR